MNVLVLAGDADNNLGDRAILQATCHELKSRLPDVQITLVSRSPDRAAQRYGAVALQTGLGGLAPLLRAAARADLVLCGGGGLFQDDDSLIKMPYWAARLGMVRLFAPRIAALALGVGPLRALSSRIAARLAFALMGEVTVRDPLAGEVAQALTNKPVGVIGDPAFLLEPAPQHAARQRLADEGVPLDGRVLIGVAPRRWFPSAYRVVPHRLARRLGRPDPQTSDEGERLCGQLAKLLDRQVERHNAHIVFLPTYCIESEGDDRLSASILARMKHPQGQIVRLDDPSLYQAVTGELSVLLGGRMHPAILAASVNTPIVGLGYNPKFHGLFTLLGMPEQVHHVETFVREGRLDALESSLEVALAGRRPEPGRVVAIKRHLQAFFDRQLGVAAAQQRVYAA
ncbi:MAG: polysaccharide pyruvyl transferase family protein [Pseudomonadota bacterium]